MATTIKSPDGVTQIINARRTESLDAPNILKLVQPSTDALFGRVNIVNLIEKAALAVTLNNDQDEILAHAAFCDYPNLPDVDPAKWEQFLSSYYSYDGATALNSLFLHYFVSKQAYAHGCTKEIIRTAFNAVPELHFIFLVVPVGVFPDSAISDMFYPMEKLEGVKVPSNFAMFACYRHNHVPVLHVRNARVEDHDDLTPIFNRQSEMLKHTYGDYFLGELIESQDEGMQCLVTEVDGSAYGFMSVSDDVNLELLNECYELGVFHGLKKPHPDDILVAPKTPTPTPTPVKPDIHVGERPNSRHSSKSTSSQRFDGKDDGDKNEDEIIIEKMSRQSSARSGIGSINSQEPRSRPKLSDNNLGDSTSSLLSAVSADSEQIGSERGVPAPPMTPKPATPIAQLPKRFVPVYKGESTAFCIQLFVIDERYEMRSMDFLAKAFALFPSCDFCIITVPHLVPEFPLLQGFLRVTPRCPSTLPHELYIFHKSGLLKDFKVRPVCTSDFAGIEKLVQTIDLQENLLADLRLFNKARRDMDGTELQAFVAESQSQIVGIGVIRIEEDIEYIRSHYNIEDFIYFNHHRRSEHGHLHHFALNPVFNHLSKHFLKEILRQGHKTCLYYPLYPPYTDREVVEKHSLVSTLSDLVPVHARRQIVYPVDKLDINAPSERVLKSQEPYALNHINVKLTLEPKVTINARIIVVGASDVGVAFLETLAYCPHLRFNNLTLISTHGLPGEMLPDVTRDQIRASSHSYNQEEYSKTALRTWINVVYGKMTAIDRKRKQIIVNGSTVVPYDHLVLATGQQYQIPSPTDADIREQVTNNEVPNSPDRIFLGTPPNNLFLINDDYDAAVALYAIENQLLKSERSVLVYGNTLDAYCCVQTLLSMGVQGRRISFVEPPLIYHTACLNNHTLEQSVLEQLKENGVDVHSGYLLAQWNDGKDSTTISSASFTSSTKPIRLECNMFISYYKKTIDFDGYKAMNDACLVFDGKLVIDAAFHTNDVAIRAAGPLTKFQRKYHADQWSHDNFNSKEVGVALASRMLRLFDPTLEPESEPAEDTLNLIPIYRSPKIQGAMLPGGYHYLHVAKPGLNVALDTQMTQIDYGRELITGSPDSEEGYFRLHISQYNTIETITCCTKQPMPTSNLMCLYGLHERYLNNLVSRFEEGLIKDFYSYFMETWCLAFYHDRFADFREEIRELLMTNAAGSGETLEEKVRQIVDEEIPLNTTQRQMLLDSYGNSGAKRGVETRLLSFLNYNYYHLPMYAKPGMV